MNIPVFDFHCDTSLAMVGKDLRCTGTLRSNGFHVDLERASTLAGYCQCFACFTTPNRDLPKGKTVEDVFEREMSVVLREVEANSDKIRLAYSPADVEKNRKEGKMSALLTAEGAAGFGYDPELLESLYLIGFRITSLGWNEKNPLTGSHITGGGLTDRGRAFVREAQRLGMLVDVSHISDEGFWDIMNITQGPVVATHSNSRSVCSVSRNLTDDMFRAICESGGIAGINMCADFIGENPDLDTACDHVFRFLELDPTGKHIALGCDLDGVDSLPRGFAGVQDYPAFAQRLSDRGLDEETVRNIFWNNAIGVMERAVCNHQK